MTTAYVQPKKGTALFEMVKCRSRLMRYFPFYGSLLMNLEMVERPDLPTLATDGVHLFFNPEYVLKLARDNFSKLMFGQCHEVHHCILGHPWRCKAMKGQRRLIATDLAINPMVKLIPELVAPDGILWPNQYDLPDMQSAEWYYRNLPPGEDEDEEEAGGEDGNGEGEGEDSDSSDGSGQGKGKGKGQPQPGKGGCCSGVMPAPGTGTGEDEGQATEDELAKLAARWEESIAQAAQIAKQMGKLPAGMERYLKERTRPVPDVEDVLRRFLKRARDDYRMFPPSRRGLAIGAYMPSLYSEELGEVVFIVDTSGSIGPDELSFFLAKVNNVCAELRPRAAHVISADADVQSVVTFTPEEYPISAETAKRTRVGAGGGGTAFKPAIAYVDEHFSEAVACVYLTDMYSSDGYPAPDTVPILWAATTEREADTGETVHITPEALVQEGY